jgi:hypothetical protein
MATNNYEHFGWRNYSVQQSIKLIQSVVSNINAMLETPAAENYSPILHTPLTVHAGISVTGNFKTTDTNGKLSYVTVLRQGNSVSAADGLGFAWYIADGTIYNVYLVDNNPLIDDIMFTSESMLQNLGENSFLATTSGVINSDTKYSFRLDIGVNYSMDLWIWDSSYGGFSETTPGIIKVNHGGFTPRSDGDHFGIAVMDTEGSEWYYDELKITSVNSLHTTAMFELKADLGKFPNGTIATVAHHGYGKDGNVPGLNGYIWNNDTEAWEAFGATYDSIQSHTYDETVGPELACLRKTFIMSNTYRGTDNFIRIAVTTPTAGLDVSDVTTYYVSLENTQPAGIHIGGKSDIYIYDPTKIALGTRTLASTDGRVNLTPAEGVVLPLMNIAKVIVSATNEELTENADWSLASENVGNAYSTRDIPYLSITTEYLSLDLDITYRYYQDGVHLQTLLDTPANRFIGTDSLAKIMPPAMVNIDNLEYSGPLTITRAYEIIKDYVTSVKTFTISEIIARLMSAGASYINVATILITVNEYNEKREQTRVASVISSYTVPNMMGMYIDEYSMTGLIKL